MADLTYQDYKPLYINGKRDKARRYVNSKGATISVRDFQKNATRTAPKAPQQARKSGKIYTRQGKTQRHGETQTLIFRNLVDAQNYFLLNGIDPKYKSTSIFARYTERHTIPVGGTSDKRRRGGYTTISKHGFIVTSDLTERTIWDEAAEKLAKDYDMSGDNARIYLYSTER